MHVTHTPPPESPVKTPEQLAGDEVRRLRKAQGWTQDDLARRMKVYGYDWGQSTVGRSETAERPLRLNEVVHLAALFHVPVTQFLLPVDMTLRDIEKEIVRGTGIRDELQKRVDNYQGTLNAFYAQADQFERTRRELAEELEQATAHLEIMRGLRDILTRGQGQEDGG